MDVRSTEWDLDFMNEGTPSKYAKRTSIAFKSAFVVDLDSEKFCGVKLQILDVLLHL